MTVAKLFITVSVPRVFIPMAIQSKLQAVWISAQSVRNNFMDLTNNLTILVHCQSIIQSINFIYKLALQTLFFPIFCCRLDQTIGKPVYHGNIRDKEKLTLCSRIGRMEAQVNSLTVSKRDKQKFNT